MKDLNEAYKNASFEKILEEIWLSFKDLKAISFSTQIEDVILIDAVVRAGLSCKFYTLDTGRLHEESYRMMDKIKFKYNIDLEVYFPNNVSIREMTKEGGYYSFRNSVEKRKKCCFVRKVEPNQLALKGVGVWITGMRKSQSILRQDLELFEWDNDLSLLKVNPLVNWSTKQIWEYVDEHKLYVHPLYKKGYASIGCEPCTRPIDDGEDLRSGRWWWETSSKECGLHN